MSGGCGREEGWVGSKSRASGFNDCEVITGVEDGGDEGGKGERGGGMLNESLSSLSAVRPSKATVG